MTVGIIGGGPAGMSAALWLKQLGIDVLLIEREPELGGLQRFNFLENHWLLGQVGKNGPMLARTFAAHIEAAGIVPRLNTEIRGVSRQGSGFKIVLGSRQGDVSEHHLAALVIAVGTRFRGAEVLAQVPGIGEIEPERLLWGPFAFQDLNRFAGQRLLVVGGGDNAHEFIGLAAPVADFFLLLARTCRKAQQGLRKAVDDLVEAGRCRVVEGASLARLRRSDNGIQVTIAGTDPTATEVDAIIVLAGYEPNSRSLEQVLAPALAGPLPVDSQAYLVADQHGRTPCPGIYAAGDIINPAVPCVATALASGAVVARTLERELQQK